MNQLLFLIYTTSHAGRVSAGILFDAVEHYFVIVTMFPQINVAKLALEANLGTFHDSSLTTFQVSAVSSQVCVCWIDEYCMHNKYAFNSDVREWRHVLPCMLHNLNNLRARQLVLSFKFV